MDKNKLLLILLLFLLLSCNRQPAENSGAFLSRLETANNLRQSNPDSALSIYDELLLQAVSEENYHQKLAVLIEQAILAEKMGNPDTAVKMLNQILRESAQTGDSSYVNPACLQLGHHYLDRGNYSLAKVYYSKILTTGKTEPLLKARALNGIGSASANAGDYHNAVRNYYEAREIFFAQGDTINATVQLQNLAIVHSENGKYELASQLNDSAIAGFTKFNDSSRLAQCFINKAIYNKNTGKNQVLEYYEAATHIFNALGDSGNINITNYNKAVYLISRKPDQAMVLLGNVLDYSQRHQIRQGEVMALNALSDLYSKTNPDKALLYAGQANQNAQEYGLKGLEFKTLKTLSLRLTEQGKYEKAAGHLFRLNDMRDSLNLDQNTRAAAELQQLYQVAALEQKNLVLAKENQQQRQQFTIARNFGILMSIFALTVSVLLAVVYRFYKSRKMAYNALLEIYREKKSESDLHNVQRLTDESNKAFKQVESASVFDPLTHKINQLIGIEKIFCDRHLTAEGMAEKLGISRRELSAYLQKEHNQNFATFINQHRIHFARKLIETAVGNPLKLDLIASEAGFNNRQTFYKAFQQITGVTPGQYHKGLKNEL